MYFKAAVFKLVSIINIKTIKIIICFLNYFHFLTWYNSENNSFFYYKYNKLL